MQFACIFQCGAIKNIFTYLPNFINFAFETEIIAVW